jgi:hypothetical protein
MYGQSKYNVAFTTYGLSVTMEGETANPAKPAAAN